MTKYWTKTLEPAPDHKIPKFVLPRGMSVLVKRVADRGDRWRDHKTERELRFVDQYSSDKSCVVFERDGWLIMVRWDKVRRI